MRSEQEIRAELEKLLNHTPTGRSTATRDLIVYTRVNALRWALAEEEI